ncbi:MAG: hypothetical protein U0L71_06065 [Eggerthellaceae bacterium]|nr:hypothetical protein [Eggerthellaceae bacterium]
MFSTPSVHAVAAAHSLGFLKDPLHYLPMDRGKRGRRLGVAICARKSDVPAGSALKLENGLPICFSESTFVQMGNMPDVFSLPVSGGLGREALPFGVGHALRRALSLLVLRVIGVRPQAFCDRCPSFDARRAFGAEVARILLRLKVGGMGFGTLHHVGEHVPILQDGAGTQQVVVERLALVAFHEDGGSQSIEQRYIVDVGIRIVRENAWLHIARRIDMQVAPSARDAAAYEFAVVLEVKREQGLLSAHLAYKIIEMLALPGRDHEVGGSIDSDGEIGEDPSEQRALIDHPIEELLGGDRIGVGPRVAA